MNEIFEYGERLQSNPDLLGWVVLALVIFVVAAQHKRILAYFDARIEAQREKVKSDAVMEELVRMNTATAESVKVALENSTAALENNSAAFNNNTAMLSLLQKERQDMIAKLESHEQLSMERIAHVQTVCNRIDSVVRENHSNIELIEDRTK